MTTYRDITPADLTHPGDVLKGAMLDGWTGTVEGHDEGGRYRASLIEGWRGSSDYTVVITHRWEPGLIPAPGWVTVADRDFGRFVWSAADARINFLDPEVRDRARRVLRARDLGRITNAEEDGTITPLVAAALWWMHIAREDAGLPIVKWLPWTVPSRDDSLLATGIPLLTPERLYLPMPEGVVRLAVTP